MKLKGSHLHNAILAYKINLQSGGTTETATNKMVANLMEEEKVVSESVANSIANWLQKIFIYTQEIPSIQESRTLEDFFTSVLNIDLNLLDRSACTLDALIQNSSETLIYSFGHDFHFVGRNDSIEQIDTCFSNYTEKIFKKERIDKLDVVIPFVAAAPGVGKSKLLKHYGELICKRGYFPLFVSFGNFCSMEKHVDIETSLSIKMIYSLYIGFGKFIAFTQMVELWIHYFGTTPITIQTVFHFINTFISKLFPNEFGNTKVKFFVAIDEVHAIDYFKSDNPLQSLISCIGKYMQSPQYILLPLLAGDNYSAIYTNLLNSTYTPNFIPMTAFLLDDQLFELIDQLATKRNKGLIAFPKLEHWRTNTDFRYLLRTFGGFPRGVEIFLQYYLSDPTIDAFKSWSLASDLLKQRYPIFIEFQIVKSIAIHFVARTAIIKENTVVARDEITWSDLENYGYVMLQPVYDSKAVVYYPPFLLETFLNKYSVSESRDVFRRVFLQNANKYWQNWENIVHAYVYLIFSLLQNAQHISLKQLFPFAKVSALTALIQFSTFPFAQTLMFISPHKLEGNISSNQKLLLQIVKHDSNVQVRMNINLTEERISIVKNENTASTGDILVFGLQTIAKERIVLHYQCKWSNEIISYSQIEQQMETNRKLTVNNSSVKNITVVICGTLINGLPNDLPNDLIIVYKENFSDFFGVLSDSMKSSCAQQFIRINELSERDLQRLKGIEESTAKHIIEKRGQIGFFDLTDLKDKLDSTSYQLLLYGTNNEELIVKDEARTILF